MATSALSYWQQLDLLVSQYKQSQSSPDQLGLRLTPEKKAKLPRSPLSTLETRMIQRIQGSVTFPPGSSHKRFIRRLNPQSQLSDRGRQYLAYIAHRYRRQWKASAEE